MGSGRVYAEWVGCAAIVLIVACLAVLTGRRLAAHRRDRRATARQVRWASRYRAVRGSTHALPVPVFEPPSWPSRVRRCGSLLYGDPYAGEVHKPHDPWQALYDSRIIRGEYDDQPRD